MIRQLRQRLFLGLDECRRYELHVELWQDYQRQLRVQVLNIYCDSVRLSSTVPIDIIRLEPRVSQGLGAPSQ